MSCKMNMLFKVGCLVFALSHAD